LSSAAERSPWPPSGSDGSPSALPEKAPLLASQRGRLGRRGRVPCGARKRWIHPAAWRRTALTSGNGSAGSAKESFRPRVGRSGSSPSRPWRAPQRIGQIGLVTLPCFRIVAEVRVSIADGDQVLGVAFLGIRRLPLPQRPPHSPRRSAFFAAAACDRGAAKAGAAQRRIATEMANARIASPCADRSRRRSLQAFAGSGGCQRSCCRRKGAIFRALCGKIHQARCPPSAPPRRCARPGRTLHRRCA